MKCANQQCQAESAGKSKYCAEHRAAAHAAWLARVRSSSAERESKVAQFGEIFKAAHEAGMAAGDACQPVPMVVSEHVNMADDNSAVRKSYYVPSGVCGFAWVTVRPGTSSFARWLVKNGKGHKAYYGGIQIWASAFGQSMERKIAYAHAFAKVLEQNGIPASTGDRMD